MNIEYREYLESDLWRGTRVLAFQKHGDICICGKVATEIHHLTYDRIGNERIDDLLPLCADCHGNYHAIEDKRKNCVPKASAKLVKELTTERDRQIAALAESPDLLQGCE